MKPIATKALLYAAASLPLVTCGACAQKQQNSSPDITRPNVLFILCDDMGYGDLGCYGQPYINTPNIDSLAANGMMFTQAYAGSPVSAPSRASLMTGQHSGHAEVRGNREYWRDVPLVQYGVNDEYSLVGQHPYDTAHVVLPEVMKDLGYTTGMFGKWAGGYEGSVSVPETRGVDRFFGYICQFQAHLYYPNFLNRYDPAKGDTATVRVLLDENIEWPMCGPEYYNRTQYSADLIHQEALRWLDEQTPEQPFFGLLTYTLPHAELAQPDDSIVAHYKAEFTDDPDWGGGCGSRYNAVTHTHAQFAAMITRLDAYVGELMAKLREKGLAENTIVVFTSDNGPHEEGGADPAFFGRDGKLRGLKRQCYEGGIRVPFIVSWPAVIKPGSKSDRQIAFYDVLPTLCDIAGVADMVERYGNKRLGDADLFDGITFAPELRGEKSPGHDWLYWEFEETDQIGLRMGDWKMVVVKGEPRLYNLADDIHEDNDIAAAHPDIVEQMVGIIRSQHQPSPLFPVTLP